MAQIIITTEPPPVMPPSICAGLYTKTVPTIIIRKTTKTSTTALVPFPR